MGRGEQETQEWADNDEVRLDANKTRNNATWEQQATGAYGCHCGDRDIISIEVGRSVQKVIKLQQSERKQERGPTDRMLNTEGQVSKSQF